MNEISKKDLLAETGISYGQLYRWKREGLIPEEWFVKRPVFTGQETFFPRERVLERVGKILEKKDEQSLEEIRRGILVEEGGELEALIHEAVMAAARDGEQASAALFETTDGKHYVVITKDGRALADSGVSVLMVLSEKEVRARVKDARQELELERKQEQEQEQDQEQEQEQEQCQEQGMEQEQEREQDQGQEQEQDPEQG